MSGNKEIIWTGDGSEEVGFAMSYEERQVGERRQKIRDQLYVLLQTINESND